MFTKTLLSATALLATTSLAQTFSDCNPLKDTGCPDPPALGTTYNHTWTAQDAELSSAYFNVTAGISGDRSLISFDDEGMHFSILKHRDSVTVKTAFYIMFGSVEVQMRAAKGQGIISTMNLLSDDLDEVDWEMFGSNYKQGSSNYYGMGNTSQHFGEYQNVDGPQEEFHNYTINWSEEKLEWILNGEVVRSVPYAPAGEYPQTPCFVNLGIWAGGDPDNSNGTIEWAGGETDYDKGPYTMTIKSIKVTDGHQNVSSYVYTNTTGSYQSIKAVEGESKAYKAINKLSTAEKMEEHWQGLSKGAKIGIACGVLGAFAVFVIAWTFLCISQRKKGKAERMAADVEWEKERADFDMYRVQMAKGGFGVSSREVDGGRF